MKRQLQLFLSVEDEKALSVVLKETIPAIVILNDNVWPVTPDRREGIEECSSGRAYLFGGPIDSLPIFRRKNGELEGPISGCVVQILRSILKDDVLFSGRVAVGFYDEDNAMKTFVSKVWRCVKKLGAVGVLTPEGDIDKGYLIGSNVAAKMEKGTIRIADRATSILYQLARKGTCTSQPKHARYNEN